MIKNNQKGFKNFRENELLKVNKKMKPLPSIFVKICRGFKKTLLIFETIFN